MWFKYPAIVMLFFIVSLLQVSFLPYFSIMTFTPNVISIIFFIIIFLKREKEYYYELFIIVIAGFCLDIFSNYYLGLSIISLFILYSLIQLIHYLFKERQNTHLLAYFMVSFLFYFMAHGLLVQLLSNPFTMEFNLGSITLIEVFYNLVLAVAGFFVYKKIQSLASKDRQLKLL